MQHSSEQKSKTPMTDVNILPLHWSSETPFHRTCIP